MQTLISARQVAGVILYISINKPTDDGMVITLWDYQTLHTRRSNLVRGMDVFSVALPLIVLMLIM
jgi:hypothetical protein